MTPTIPRQVTVTALNNGEGIPRQFVRISFKMLRKNNFSFIFGPSNKYGEIIISRDVFVDRADATANLFLMDYGDLCSDWSGEIIIKPLGVTDLEGALDAYDAYKESVSYPAGYKSDLTEAINHLQHISPTTLTATVLIESDGARPVIHTLDTAT